MKLDIPGEPVPKARPRLGKGGRWYTPRESVAYEDRVGWYARQTRITLPPPVKVTADFYCSPRSPQQLPDLDNLLKALLDGLAKGGVFANDRDIVAIEVYRWQDTQPRTEVIVERVGDRGAVVPATT